jgi:hypothetical protein
METIKEKKGQREGVKGGAKSRGIEVSNSGAKGDRDRFLLLLSATSPLGSARSDSGDRVAELERYNTSLSPSCILKQTCLGGRRVTSLLG